MHNQALEKVISQFQAQRRSRADRRSDFQRRLKTLQESFSHRPVQMSNSNLHHQQQGQINFLGQEHIPKVDVYQANPYQTHESANISHSLSAEEEQAIQENKMLKEALARMENEQRQRLEAFQVTIGQIRQKYSSEMQKMESAANQNRQAIQEKFLKLKEQLPLSIKKNQDIQKLNASLLQDVSEGEALMQKYGEEIRAEYGAKLNQIQKIYETSNQKIDAYQKQFNEDQFVQNTLKSQQYMKAIQENARKAEDATQLYNDYNSLLAGKQQILQEIIENNAMKEQQIEKMSSIETRMKAIMDQMSKDKHVIINQNEKMANQLMQVKQLLVATMGSPNNK